MYFRELEKLKASREFNDNTLRIVDSLLFDIYNTKDYHERFSPRVYNYFKKGYKDFENIESEWLEILDLLSKYGCLSTNFEIFCPYCEFPNGGYEKISQIPLNSHKECEDCDTEFEIHKDNVLMTYTFNEAFKPSEIEAKPNGGGDNFFRGDGAEVIDRFSLDNYCFYPERICERHITENITELRELFKNADNWEKGEQKGHETKKGDALADFVKRLLPSVYFEFLGEKVRVRTGEIDILYLICKTDGKLSSIFSDKLAVECKNWEHKAPTDEISHFGSRMTLVKAHSGLFISKNGITGNTETKRDAIGNIGEEYKHGKTIMVITYQDFEDIINQGKNLFDVFKEKFLETIKST